MNLTGLLWVIIHNEWDTQWDGIGVFFMAHFNLCLILWWYEGPCFDGEHLLNDAGSYFPLRVFTFRSNGHSSSITLLIQGNPTHWCLVHLQGNQTCVLINLDDKGNFKSETATRSAVVAFFCYLQSRYLQSLSVKVGFLSLRQRGDSVFLFAAKTQCIIYNGVHFNLWIIAAYVFPLNPVQECPRNPGLVAYPFWGPIWVVS